MIIDAHHHFWRYNTEEYGWMDDTMSALRRDFLPDDLTGEINEVGVDGVVSVQARQITDETSWLLEMAEEHEFIRGVVGWVPLSSPNVGKSLEEFSSHSKLKAVRHILHDEVDDDYMLREEFCRGIALLRQFDLAYDILIYEHHLPQSIELVDRHPNQIFVLDHVAKPKIKAGQLSPWQENIRKISEREAVYCKLSGMVTEADWNNWAEEELRPYFDVVLEAFGPERLMFGSDWPVSTLACTYKWWYQTVQKFVGDLSGTEYDRIMGGTAIEAYRLEDAISK